MFERGKEAALRRFVEDSDIIDAITNIVATLEVNLLDEVAALQDALDIEHIENVPSEEERADQLANLIEARLNGSVADLYAEEVLAEHVDGPDAAAAYLGLSDEEWQQQIEQWADTYRSKGAGDGLTDREIAANHIQRRYGVPIEEFERNVVDYDEGEMLRSLLATNFETAIEGVRRARREVQA